VPIRADWVGFEVPDRFLVGYGLDHAGRFRALDYVGAIDG
jgi:hypoxanthine phosphoribosyltransferase